VSLVASVLHEKVEKETALQVHSNALHMSKCSCTAMHQICLNPDLEARAREHQEVIRSSVAATFSEFMSHLPQDTGNASARTSNFCLSSVCCTTDKTIGTTESDSHRPRHAIIPTAKLTDASNSSKPALKSHQAAADAQRAAIITHTF
jgi:hypothetical protein